MVEFVLFSVNNNELFVGYVVDQKKNTIQLKILKNNTLENFTTSASRIQKRWKKEIENEEKLIQELSNINNKLTKNLKISFQKLLPGKYCLEEISEILNEKDEEFLFIQILKSDLIKRKGEVYYVLSKEEVKKKRFEKNIKNWNNKNSQLSEEDSQTLLMQLQSIFNEDHKSEYWESISRVFGFKKNPLSYEVDLKILFERLNYKITWDEFYIKKNKLDNNFKMNIDISEIVKEMKKKTENRINYSTNTFTIDSKKTRDYDDAFTISFDDENNMIITVHITDIASFLPEFPQILNESKARIKSVYLLDKKFPMMPQELSEDLFSLKENAKRLTISYEMLFTKETVEFKSIYLSKIEVQQNLTYDTAHEHINEKHWNFLVECCENIQKRRMKNSENEKQFCDECLIDISDKKKIIISKSQRRLLKSNLIINELAILVNSFEGKYLNQNKIPCIYKNLSKFSSEPIEKDDIYVQCTSPIRRFADLINQNQIISSIEKTKIFSSKEIEEMIPLIQLKSEEISNLESKYKKYWIYEFLSQNSEKNFSCEILHILPHCCEVKFVDYSFILPAHGIKNVKKGDLLDLKFKVDHERLLLNKEK